MNVKSVWIGLASAVFAAGLTYWAVSPPRSGTSVVATAKLAPQAGPPLIISTAGPEAQSPPEPTVMTVKRSPTAATVAPAAPVAVDEPVVIAAPSKPLEPPAAVVPSEPVAQPLPAVANPAPPERIALSPPKEIDRVETAVIRDREIRGGPNTATINQGTLVTVRMGETLSVQKNLAGDTFFATLDQPLVAGGFVIAEKGARVEGKIVEVDKAGRMSGTSRISLELTQVNTSDGQRIHLQTSTYSKDGADRNRKNDAAKIGGGAVLGAVIGAAAGGGKGAGVGAAAGGAAGAGAVLLSGGRNITIPVETKLSFRVEKPIIITERVVQ